LSDEVHITGAYAGKGASGRLQNSGDGIFGQSNGELTLDVTPDGAGYATAFAFGILVGFLRLRAPDASRRALLGDLLFLLFAVFVSVTLHAGTVAVILRRARRGLVLLASTRGGQRYVAMLQRRPAVVLVLSFAATIALGTVLLTFAAATEDGRGEGVPFDITHSAISGFGDGKSEIEPSGARAQRQAEQGPSCPFARTAGGM